MRNTRLDHFEQQIENDADRFVPVDGAERSRIEQILADGRKERNVASISTTDTAASNDPHLVEDLAIDLQRGGMCHKDE